MTLEGLTAGIDVFILYDEMMRNTKRILDSFFAAKPNVHVYHFGYEILDWSGSAYCEGFSSILQGSYPKCADKTNVTCMTELQSTWLQTNFVDNLTETYKSNPFYHGINLLGTLQVAGGVPGAAVGTPNPHKYSPSKYVRHESSIMWGCVHLTPAGYTALYTELAKHVQPGGDRGAPATREMVVESERRWKASPPPLPSTLDLPPPHAERRSCLSDPSCQCWVVGG